MTATRIHLLIIIAAICLSAAAAVNAGGGVNSKPEIVSAEPAPDLNALFESKSGWVGSDAAYSAVLGKDRVLWLFGDTFIGTVKDGRRIDCVMVNNTAAIQTGRGKDATIHFVTGKPKNGKSTSLFMPSDGKGWLWPQAASKVGDKLFLFLPQIDRAGGGGAFGFRQIAQWLAVIENPGDDPAEWRITQTKIPFCDYTPGNTISLGSAMLLAGGDVYVYGISEKTKGPDRKKLIVARAPIDQFANFKTWRFRTATGWSDSLTDAVTLAAGLASEFSVSQLPGGRGFVAVYTENGLGDRIMARFADAPDGPWSAPALLYTAPEMKKDKGVFCYSAKAHPWAAEGNELVITYCQNAWEFKHVFENDEIYRPKFVRVKLADAAEK